MDVIKEIIKLIITTAIFPIIILFVIILTFIGAHEAIWHSKGREVNSEQ
mgnify:CR=1 FL=1